MEIAAMGTLYRSARNAHEALRQIQQAVRERS